MSVSRIRIPNSQFRIPKILFVHNHLASFVRIDRDLLAERYALREWHQRGRAVNLFALTRAVRECDLVFGWFASWHTFFPVWLAALARRPAVIVTGGYDVANLPELGYGHMRGGVQRFVAMSTLRRAAHLIPFSVSARNETLMRTGIASARVTTMYLGMPPAPSFAARKENLVLTVGNVKRDNFERKGLEPFVRAAAYLPETPFVVIGAWKDDSVTLLKQMASPNVEFTGWVDETRLQEYMARARVCVQASQHEGFGMAVAEAMLHKCIPVVTRAGALPEVVGDAGVYAESSEPAQLADAIRCALAQDGRLGARACERIAREFPLERRREKMFALVDELLNGRA